MDASIESHGFHWETGSTMVDPKRLLVQTPSYPNVRSLPWQGHSDHFSVYVHGLSTSEEDLQSTDRYAAFADRRIPSIEVCASLIQVSSILLSELRKFFSDTN